MAEFFVLKSDDVFTHKDAWRRALEKLRDQSDETDAGYYQHEINAFDRVYAEFEATPKVDERARNLTERIVSGIIVHGFDNDADAAKIVLDQEPAIRAMLTKALMGQM